MKKLPIAISLLLFLFSMLQAQKVKTSEPILEVIVSETPAPSSEEIIISLRPPESDSIASVLSDDFEIKNCIVTESSKKMNPIQATFIGGTNKMKWKCEIPLKKGTNPTTDRAKLRANWSSLKLAITYRAKDTSGSWNNPVVFPLASPFNKCFKFNEVKVKFGKVKRIAKNQIITPIELNTDFRVQVELKDGDKTVARIKANDIALPRRKMSDVILEKIDDTGTVLSTTKTYSVVVSPTANQSHIPFKDNQNNNVTLSDFTEYEIEADDVSKLEKINPKDDGSVNIEFVTTDRGNIRLFLNNSNTPLKSALQTTHKFNISEDKIKSGANTIRFEGESDDEIKLSKKTTFSFIKQPRTFLDKDNITFSLDDKDILTIHYKLTRKLENRWQFIDSEGKAGLGALSDPVPNKDGEYKAKIDLKTQNTDFIELIKKELKGEKVKKGSIVVQIYNAKDDKDIIGSFKLDFIQPDQTTSKKLKEIIELVRKGGKSTPKKQLGELLGQSKSSPVVESIFNLFKGEESKQGEGKKNLVYTALRIAGKIGAGIFGIPLPF